MQILTSHPPVMHETHPETLANRLSQLETSTLPPRTSSSPSPISPTGGKGPSLPGGAGGVLENGTNTGSMAGRKASVSGRSSFSLDKGPSQGGSGLRSRRGSGVVLTPNGTQAVYHTRHHVGSKGLTLTLSSRQFSILWWG